MKNKCSDHEKLTWCVYRTDNDTEVPHRVKDAGGYIQIWKPQLLSDPGQFIWGFNSNMPETFGGTAWRRSK